MTTAPAAIEPPGPPEPGEIRFDPVAGPATDPMTIPAEAEVTIGRSLQCTCTLAGETVSRRHASVEGRGGHWLLTDLGSRHGTYLHANRLDANVPTVLANGDLVGIGPYTFRVGLGPRTTDITTTTVGEARPARTRIERVRSDEIERLAQARMNLLVECAARIHGATGERDLADQVLESALAGSGFQHAALLRPIHADSDELEMLGHRHHTGADTEAIAYSRSLIEEASAGQMVRLTEARDLPRSESIAELGITAALCAPVMLGTTIAAYLYLDARDEGSRVERDAAAFCQVIARMCGLALSNLKRQDLERRHERLDADVQAARKAQQFIVPATEGVVGPVRYAMKMQPGHFVAGDLFDIIALDERRTAIVIGDVTGEGVGAAVIMAAAQAHLHAELLRSGDPATAVNAVNRYLSARSAADRFVSLWVGVVDGAQTLLRYVDAGHGHWLLKPSGETPRTLSVGGGIPAGIDGTYDYPTEERGIFSGDRLILFSDGLIEQRAADGQQFGKDRVAEAIVMDDAPTDDITGVLAAFDAFATGMPLHDDTTVASVEVV